MSAVFTVPYGPDAKSTSRPETLEMAVIDGILLRPRCGSDALTRFTVPRRSTRRLASQFSGVSAIARALTLLTTASIPPKSPATASTQALTAGPSPTSST